MDVVTAATVAGPILVVVGAMLRWGVIVDRGITNAVHASEVLRERLEAHEGLDEERFVETKRRLGDLEDRARWG